MVVYEFFYDVNIVFEPIRQGNGYSEGVLAMTFDTDEKRFNKLLKKCYKFFDNIEQHFRTEDNIYKEIVDDWNEQTGTDYKFCGCDFKNSKFDKLRLCVSSEKEIKKNYFINGNKSKEPICQFLKDAFQNALIDDEFFDSPIYRLGNDYYIYAITDPNNNPDDWAYDDDNF